jgi:hypothetical protein
VKADSILLSVHVRRSERPLVKFGELTNCSTVCSKCILLAKIRQRSSAWALLVENINRTKSLFIILFWPWAHWTR